TGALRAGTGGAVAAARGGIGADGLEAALAYGQPAVLTSENRVALGDRHDMRHWARDLRAHAAHELGEDAPPLAHLHRISGGALAMSLGTLFAMALLLSKMGDPED